MNKYGMLVVSVGVGAVLFAYAYQIYLGENNCIIRLTPSETKAQCAPSKVQMEDSAMLSPPKPVEKILEKREPPKNHTPDVSDDNGSKAVIKQTEVAIVFNPPSNVREEPNGRVICSVRNKTAIDILGKIGAWYRTDVCNGLIGYIHKSQLNYE